MHGPSLWVWLSLQRGLSKRCSQLFGAALSSALNLMEGSAKPTRADKRRFYAIAYGSIREVQAILDIISNQDLLAQADRLGAMAWKLMQAT